MFATAAANAKEINPDPVHLRINNVYASVIKSQEEPSQIKLVDLSAHPFLVTAVSLYSLTMTQTSFTLLPFQVVANKISYKHFNKQS